MRKLLVFGTALKEYSPTFNNRWIEYFEWFQSVEKELDEAKFVTRLDPIGIDRHGRRYMLMPHYGGLLIQSIGSREWIEDDDGNEYFGKNRRRKIGDMIMNGVF